MYTSKSYLYSVLRNVHTQYISNACKTRKLWSFETSYNNGLQWRAFFKCTLLLISCRCSAYHPCACRVLRRENWTRQTSTWCAWHRYPVMDIERKQCQKHFIAWVWTSIERLHIISPVCHLNFVHVCKVTGWGCRGSKQPGGSPLWRLSLGGNPL